VTNPIEQFAAIRRENADVLGSHEETQKADCEDLGYGENSNFNGG